MKEKIKDEVMRAVRAVLKDETATSDGFEIETPRRKEFGDFSTNAAMALSKNCRLKPRELAAEMVGVLQNRGIFEKVEVAGPGFINFFVKPSELISKLPVIKQQGRRFGSIKGEGKTVLLEFVSANPTGPLHFGHARGAVVGDVLGNVLEFSGWKVTREFYINDAGNQMEMLGESVRANLLGLLGSKAEIPEDGYRGEYISEIARAIFNRKGADKGETERDFCRDFAYEKLLGEIRADLSLIGVEFDNWVSEKKLLHEKPGGGKNMLDKTMEKLRETGAVKNEDGAEWFRATEYGDSKDRVLIKKDGAPTYFLSDIAYHKEKFSRGYDKLVNIWGADHHSHVARIKSALSALGIGKKALDVLLIQFVRLVKDGKEESMGKRAGSYVTLKEVADGVGTDVTRFFLLMRGVESHLDFDLDLARKQSNENPVYYIQYARARVESIKRNAAGQKINASEDGLDLLVLDEEIEITKILLAFPDTVKDSAQTLAPHKIAFYLQGLASVFHSYYNANRVLTDNSKLSSARLFLCECVGTVLQNGLGILGVKAPERM